jgi:hypothetical protein
MTAAEALLGITLPASTEEIKKAYRRQIARYHPDKVHHLGEEFQLLAAEKSAQLTDIYHQLLESGGCDPSVNATPIVSDEPSPVASAPANGAATNRAARMSSWQAVEQGCPSLILGAATDRMIQCVRSTLPGADELTVAGFSLACRTRVDWRGRLLRRRSPTYGVLLRTPADAPANGRRAARLREVLPGVDGAIVLFDLVVDPRVNDRRDVSDPPTPTRAEPYVFTVSVDAMTWKARVPDEAPEMAHQILARVRARG